MRYYDQVQNYDDNSLQTTLPASYPTGGEVGNEQQSLGPRLNQLWSHLFMAWEVRWEAVCLRFHRGTVSTSRVSTTS